jgi:DNA-binding PadR family transcriptional regulator
MPNISKISLLPSEIVLLFLVKVGIGTPYMMFNLAGVPIGASSPALKRLEDRLGLLNSEEEGSRNSRHYSLTTRGEELLNAALRAGPEVYAKKHIGSRYMSLHRAIFFAWITGRRDEAFAAIDSAEKEIKLMVEQAELNAQKFRNIMKNFDWMSTTPKNTSEPEFLAAVFRMIQAVADGSEFTGQVTALPNLRKLVKELPHPPSIFLQHQPSPVFKREAADKGGKRNRGR